MTSEKRRHTFISYSRVNEGFAIKLATELKEAGFPIWFDQMDIPAGSRWDDEIEKALRECGIFLTILTPASIASENAKDEMGYAIDHGKRILPVLLEDCEIPLRLRRFQYVDFTSMNYDQGVRTAKDLLERFMREASVPVAKKNTPGKERPTQPSIRRSAETKSDTRKKIDLAENVRKSSKPSATQRVVIYAGIAAFFVLVLVGGASLLRSIFPFTPQIPTNMPTQQSAATSIPSATVLAATPTPEFRGFYTEEFDSNLDSWTFLRRRGKDASEFHHVLEDGRLVVSINPKQDTPWAHLINNDFMYSDVQLEVVVKNNSNNGNGVSLICRHSESGWIEFTVSNDQSYSIYVFGPNGETLQGGAAGSKKILAGQAENVYVATCKGNQLSLSINGSPINTIKINRDLPEGNIGIGFSAPRNVPVAVEFESLKISQP